MGLRPEGRNVGHAGRSLAWRMQDASSRRPSHCGDAERDKAVLHWMVSWLNLAGGFESAGMQRGRQVKHTSVSRHLGCPDFVEVVLGQVLFFA